MLSRLQKAKAIVDNFDTEEVQVFKAKVYWAMAHLYTILVKRECPVKLNYSAVNIVALKSLYLAIQNQPSLAGYRGKNGENIVYKAIAFLAKSTPLLLQNQEIDQYLSAVKISIDTLSVFVENGGEYKHAVSSLLETFLNSFDKLIKLCSCSAISKTLMFKSADSVSNDNSDKLITELRKDFATELSV